MDFFHGLGTSIFEVPGFTKLSCVKMKLQSATKQTDPNLDPRIESALARLRHGGVMASRLRCPSGNLNVLVAFEKDQARLRQRLRSYECRDPDLRLDLGDDLCLQYVSVDQLDFASPDFHSSLNLSTQPCEYFWALLAFFEAAEETVRLSFLASGQFTRLSLRTLKSTTSDSSFLHISVGFTFSGSLQVRFHLTQSFSSHKTLQGIHPPTANLAFLMPASIVGQQINSNHTTSATSGLLIQRSATRSWLSEKLSLEIDVVDDSHWLDFVLDARNPFDAGLSMLANANCFLSWPKTLVTTVKSLLNVSAQSVEIEASSDNDGFGAVGDELRWVCDWQKQRPLDKDTIAKTPAQEFAALSFLDTDSSQKAEKDSPQTTVKASADSQNANTIYPTPSDGPLTQATPASTAMEGVQPTETLGPRRADLDDSNQPKPFAASNVTDSIASRPTSQHPGKDAVEDSHRPSLTLTEDDFDFFGEREDHELPLPVELESTSMEVAHASTSDHDNETQNMDLTSDQERVAEVAAGSPLLSRSHTFLTPHLIQSRLNQAGSQFQQDMPPAMIHFGRDVLSRENVVGSSDLKYASNSRFDFAFKAAGTDRKVSHETDTSKDALPFHSSPGRDIHGPSVIKSHPPDSDSDVSYSDASEEDSDVSSEPESADLAAPRNSASIYSHVRPPDPSRTSKNTTTSPDRSHNMATKLRDYLERCYHGFHADMLPFSVRQSITHPFKFESTGDIARDRRWSAILQDMVAQAIFSRLPQKQINGPEAHSLIALNTLRSGLDRIDMPAVQRHFLSLATQLEANDDANAHVTDMANRTTSLSERLIALPTPMVRIQRNQSCWDMLPSAIEFWETLGLAPANGSKDLHIVAVTPTGIGFKDSAALFLDQFKAVYINYRLGAVHIGLPGLTNSGIFSRAVHGLDPSEDSRLASIENSLESLGEQLRMTSFRRPRAMVFILDPLETSESLARICCFCDEQKQLFYEALAKSKRRFQVEIEFRILKLSTIVKKNLPVSLSNGFASRLARSVYGQFGLPLELKARSDLCIRAAPCIELAPAPPKAIPFELTAHAPEYLMLQNSCLHVAYAIDPSKTWLTAVWIDTTGKHLFKSTYSIAGRDFNDTFRVIWETTTSIISTLAVRWRIFVAKASFLTRSEQYAWLQTFKQYAVKNVSVTLLGTALRPDFHISPDLLPAHVARTAPVAPDVAMADEYTPSSSGQVPSTGTPTAASTPSATPREGDPSARLTDPLDESWALLFHESCITYHAEDTAPAPQASGLLLKRVGTADSDPPVFLQADLLWTNDAGPIDPKSATHDGQRRSDDLLKEVLTAWRGLALLARLWGVEDAQSTTPWHLAIAEQAVECAAETVTLSS